MSWKINPKNSYLVGVSGGPDSVFLLHYLIYELKCQNLFLAHINYHARNTSDIDEKVVQDLAIKFNIPIFVHNVNKNEAHGNFQNYARNIRYNFFQKIYFEQNCKGLFLAHHANDCLESYLWQKQNRENIFYYGIKENNFVLKMKIFRPLLNIWKIDILEYLNKNNINFAVDITNEKLIYERNKIRNTLKSYTQQELNNLLNNLQKNNKKWNQLFLKIVKKINFKNNYCKIESFLLLSSIEQLCLLNKISNNIISKKNISEIIKFLVSNSTRNSLLIFKDFVIEKKYEYVFFYYQKMIPEYNKNYILKSYSELFGNKNIPIKFSETFLPNFISKTLPNNIKNLQILNYSNLDKNYKFDSKLFIKNKIPKNLRSSWPIFVDCDKKQIIWVPKINKTFSLSKESTDFSFTLFYHF